MAPPGAAAPSTVELATAALAVDPVGLGGIRVRCRHEPARRRWEAELRALLPAGAPLRRVSPSTPAAALVGGLDLAATLRSGAAVRQAGALARADGGLVVIPGAERLDRDVAAVLIGPLDTGHLTIEREGVSDRVPARFGLVLFDESLPDEPGPPTALLERVALDIPLPVERVRPEVRAYPDPAAIGEARDRAGSVRVADERVRALVEAATVLGIPSARPPVLALRAARAFAALAGRTEVDDEDLRRAILLVLFPRARSLPGAEPPPDAASPEPPPDAASRAEKPPGAEREPPAGEGAEDGVAGDGTAAERMVGAVRVALPADLLDRTGGGYRPVGAAGRSGDGGTTGRRGRRIGVRPGDPRRRRLAVLDTLRAAAPWQRLRTDARPEGPPLRIEPRDLRVELRRTPPTTTTVFVVDLSGSHAMHRLAEAKGAIETLLGQSYVRRDRVALVAFRGKEAALLLPPTRALARARRELAHLAAGGGTPLAAGLLAGVEVAGQAVREGGGARLVLLTDGRANVGLSGEGGRAEAERDALRVAGAVRASGVPSVWIDTARRPRPFGAELAERMGGRYLRLPGAGSGQVAAALRDAEILA